MKSRALRFTLLALYVGLVGAAAYTVWKNEVEGVAAGMAARTFDARARAAARTVLDMKATQPGYVAAGQGGEFWAQRMDALLSSARDSLASFGSLPHSPAAGSELETARTALEDFGQMDRRARDYARHSQALLASDLIFTDGIEKLDTTVAALDRSRAAEAATAELLLRQRRRVTLAWTVGAVAACFLIALLLTPVPRSTSAPIEASSTPVEADLPIRFEPPRRPADASAVVAVSTEPAVPSAPAALVAPAAPPAEKIEGIAALCVEFSRLPGLDALPAALQHAAALLDASGIVIWVADPEGRELAPIAAHGYPPHIVTRMGRIDRDAENVTAAAFRTGLVQTVKPDAVSAGAIAAPLLSPAGAVGVLAAEIQRHRESGDDTRAMAAIVAAQISPLVAPPMPRNTGRTEAAGA